MAGTIFGLTALLYLPVANNGFVSLDDTTFILRNPWVQKGFTPETLRWAFTTRWEANWQPLTWLSHMLDVRLFGLAPGPHHLMSAGLHAASGALLFLLLVALTGRVWRSAFVAALFAVHPLQVESVAWAAERKNVLSTLFWFLTMAAWLGYLRRPGRGRYALALGCFGAGLLAKPMLVTLPFVLLLMDFWPLGRLRKQRSASGPSPWSVPGLVAEKTPFFLLALASSGMTYRAQLLGGAVASLEARTLGSRLLNALTSWGAYLGKMLWPRNLACYYPYPEAGPSPAVALACFGLLAAVTLIVLASRKRPYLLTGWLWYLGTLVPVIGIVQVGNQALADRYASVPLVGVFLALAWLAGDLAAPRRPLRALVAWVGGIVVVCLMAATRVQLHYWKDSETLFGHALAVTQGNDLIHNNLGKLLLERRDYSGAQRHLDAALRIAPSSYLALTNRGVLSLETGDPARAIEYYLRALEVRPDVAEVHYNLGIAYSRLGKVDAALWHYRKTLALRPDLVEPHFNLALLLSERGNLSEAIEHLREASRLGPGEARVHYELGSALLRAGQREEARQELETALRLDPGLGAAREALRRSAAP